MSRRKAREIVLCLVFEKEYHKDAGCEKLYGDLVELAESAGGAGNPGSPEADFADLSENLQGISTLTEADKKYIRQTFFGVFENLEQIDDVISSSVVGWKYSRISKISMALLRIAVYELMNPGENVSPAVAINEAVELSKIYDDSKAYGFVNGVLGSVAKSIKTA